MALKLIGSKALAIPAKRVMDRYIIDHGILVNPRNFSLSRKFSKTDNKIPLALRALTTSKRNLILRALLLYNRRMNSRR